MALVVVGHLWSPIHRSLLTAFARHTSLCFCHRHLFQARLEQAQKRQRQQHPRTGSFDGSNCLAERYLSELLEDCTIK
jgi:hypothetical protein